MFNGSDKCELLTVTVVHCLDQGFQTLLYGILEFLKNMIRFCDRLKENKQIQLNEVSFL